MRRPLTRPARAFALSLALFGFGSLAASASAQQLPGEDPLWPKELREEGRQAGELRRLRELNREREHELARLRARLQELSAEDQAQDQAEAPTESGERAAEVERLRAEVERLRAETERLRAAEAPEAPALAPAPTVPAPGPSLAPPAPPAEVAPLPSGAPAPLAGAAQLEQRAARLLRELLGPEAEGLLSPEQRQRALQAVAASYRVERAASGRERFRVDEGEALAVALNALGLDEALMAESYQVVSNRLRGPSGSADAAATACADALSRYRLRGGACGAPLVVTLSGRLAYEPLRGVAGYRATLRAVGLEVRLYHRPSRQVIREEGLTSDPDLRLGEGTARALSEPWIADGASVGEVGQRYAAEVGYAAGVRAAQALLADLLRGERGLASAEAPAECLAEAPTLAPAPRVPAASEFAPSAVLPARYVLRFNGLPAAEVDRVVERLIQNQRFGRWKHVASVEGVHVYACDYAGRGVVCRLREALAADGIPAQVRKRGPRLTVTP